LLLLLLLVLVVVLLLPPCQAWPNRKKSGLGQQATHTQHSSHSCASAQ
jgi:hypothetical protein